MRLEENQKKILFYVCVGVVIALQVILMWQCKQYYDTAVYFRELYIGCQNSTINWGNFIQ